MKNQYWEEPEKKDMATRKIKKNDYKSRWNIET